MGRRIEATACDRDDVQGAVELSVAAAVEAIAVVVRRRRPERAPAHRARRLARVPVRGRAVDLAASRSG